MLMQCFIHVKVHFEKKNPILPFLGTSQKYDNVATPYCPFFAPLFVNWSLTGG